MIAFFALQSFSVSARFPQLPCPHRVRSPHSRLRRKLSSRSISVVFVMAVAMLTALAFTVPLIPLGRAPSLLERLPRKHSP